MKHMQGAGKRGRTARCEGGLMFYYSVPGLKGNPSDIILDIRLNAFSDILYPILVAGESKYLNLSIS
jgi:hypothetical protein